MISIFSREDNDAIKDRINKLTPDSRPLWGKMSVSQMVAHLQRPILVSFGELKIKRGILGILFGKMAKRQMLMDKPFKHNMPTVKEFKIAGEDFEKEKNLLLSYIDRYANKGTQIITKEPHPFFGKMTLEEWDTLQWKHLDHHLRQFGV
ncbi:MAG: DUF1569 domain-containing protein [Ginsengibacter sp.]